MNITRRYSNKIETREAMYKTEIKPEQSDVCVKDDTFVDSNQNDCTNTFNDDVVIDLQENIENIENKIAHDQANSFFEPLYDYIKQEKASTLPHFYFSSEDGDAFFEWIFDSFRFGFLFCINQDESGWYLISKKGNDYERKEGDFDDKNAVNFVIEYVRSNA